MAYYYAILDEQNICKQIVAQEEGFYSLQWIPLTEYEFTHLQNDILEHQYQWKFIDDDGNDVQLNPRWPGTSRFNFYLKINPLGKVEGGIAGGGVFNSPDRIPFDEYLYNPNDMLIIGTTFVVTWVPESEAKPDSETLRLAKKSILEMNTIMDSANFVLASLERIKAIEEVARDKVPVK